MRSFYIGKTRPRWAIALVAGATALAVVLALTGHAGLFGTAGEALFSAAGAPWLRVPVSVAMFAAMGMLALQVMVTTSTYWKLDAFEIRYRSNDVSADFLSYAWAVLRGREPEVDVRLAVPRKRHRRLCLSHSNVETFRIHAKIGKRPAAWSVDTPFCRS